MPDALRAAWIRQVQSDAGPEYAMVASNQRPLEARHPRQDLRARFTHDGVTLSDRQGAAPLRMALTRVNGRDPGPATLSHDSNRAALAREGIEEWYVHGPMGLEQGFTMDAPREPERAPAFVRLEMTIEGGYVPSSRGDVIVWSTEQRSIETRELYAFDASGRQLGATMHASDGLLTFEVDVTDAEYPIEIDPVWLEQQKLVASDATALGWFGHSVSVSGTTAVVGMPRDAPLGMDSGSAYVFVRSTGWSVQQKLTPSDGDADDRFGVSVSVSGDTVAVGALLDDDNGADAGAAYVFERSGSVWTQTQKLLASDGAAGDRFGCAVGVSGDTVLVGAREDDEAGPESGSAYVFFRSGAVWNEQQKLTAPDRAGGDFFGAAVSLSVDTAVIGAYRDDDNGSESGSAYVFTRSGSSWTEQQKLVASDGGNADRFGFSVFVDGDAAVVGAPLDDDNGTNAGGAYIFVRSGSVWSEQQKLLASDGEVDDQFGYSVGLSGDTAAVGARLDDDNGTNGGAAYAFLRTGSVWSEQGKAHGSSGSPSENFGTSVAISGDALLGGAPMGYRPGIAYMYERVGSVWSAEAKIYPQDAGASDEYFGSSVSIAGDTAVIGAPSYDDGLLTNSGAAYVFVRRGSVWAEQQELLAPDAAAHDQFGIAVSISGDTIVVGSAGDDDNGSSSGSAYVFVRSGSVWSRQQKLLAWDGVLGDQFGHAVSSFGDSVIIGAELDDDDGSASGSAYVFVRSGSVWTGQQKLVASDGAANDRFGVSVSIHGDAAVVGAMLDDDAGSESGSAYVFTRSGSVWTQQQKLAPADGGAGDRFGGHVAISVDTTLIGAELDDDNGIDSGSAYVFTRSGFIWTQQQKLLASDGAARLGFGFSVSVDGDAAVIGSSRNTDNGVDSGSAYVFVRSGSVWTEEDKLLAFDGQEGDRFGWSVSLSSDTAMIGARGDDDRGPDGGAAYAFRLQFENGEECSFDDECVSGFCEPMDLVCACDETVDCLASEVCDTSEDPNACEPLNTCGNGVVEAGEACDDGGTISGDGCSARCFVDGLPNGSDCTIGGAASCASGVCDATETPATCEPAGVCGNAVLDSDEACDDGGTVSGDGCSESCFIEGQPDGSNCTLGRDSACLSGVCDTTETPATCEPANQCGNGVVEGNEVCDDGNASAGDGCDPGCILELGAGPCADGRHCRSGLCNTLARSPVCALPNVCGNGVRDPGEACDDGNQGASGWCTASCGLKNDWRGGGGCSVGTSSGTGGQVWLSTLLAAMLLRRRRQRGV